MVRDLPAFSGFLAAAAVSDGGIVNFASIARQCGVSAPTVREYFRIHEDILLARFVPAWTRRPNRRKIQAPKFHFSDVGVVNALARRGRLEPGSELFGRAFESWVHDELYAYRAHRDPDLGLAHWRLASGIEVDFIVGDMEVAVEAKASGHVVADHLKGLRALTVEHPRVRRRIVVRLEPRARRTQDGIDILPWRRFCEELWSGGLRRTGSRPSRIPPQRGATSR